MIYLAWIPLLISLHIHNQIILDTVVQPGINFFEDEPEPPAPSEEGKYIEDLKKILFLFSGCNKNY